MKLSVIVLPLLLLAGTSLLTQTPGADAAAGRQDLVLSKRVMQLAETAAQLSALAYQEDPPYPEAYDYFGFYDAEPDQALVAKKNGYCFGAFRGTTLTWDDWQQNLVLGNDDVCHDDEDGGQTCCTTRTGFWQAYNTDYRAEMENSLRNCAKDCVNKDECVILTGHSQGGAIAAVAGIYLADLNPYVITFGQPPTIDAPCDLITSERWFRFVNTKSVKGKVVGIAYDPVPFAPSMGTENFGHMIMLSDDKTGVAYIGLDVQEHFRPLNIKGFEAHSMMHAEESDHPGYLDRLKTLLDTYSNRTYPVATTGYIAGSLCTEDKECASGHCGKETGLSWKRCIGTDCKRDSECDSNRCDSGICAPQLGTCMVCDEDSDCIHGHCSLLFRCSGEGGLMDNECGCVFDTDCRSGRCEGVKGRVCEARLGLEAYCNENSDCISNYCSWKFRCAHEPETNNKHSWWSFGGQSKDLAAAESLVVVVPSSSRAIDLDTERTADPEMKSTSSTDDVVYADDTDDSTGKASKVTIGVMVLLVVVGGGYLYYGRRRRRQGYDEIPASLSV